MDADEAKAYFSRLLDEVASGASMTVTRNGEAVARIVPIENRRERVRRLRRESRDLRGRIGAPLAIAQIKAWVQEGRR